MCTFATKLIKTRERAYKAAYNVHVFTRETKEYG
jgi:hypothetical protein